ncbi:4-hydroxy-3-methylbut-2-enyl diphosphate reductase [Candidatus Parabeggiatoa sp. HSG14]|uniref:4-hydroxy-3-methylbut-2-enyl diphosphate reductase n=1 Tax=Candidatus Parabeggiatoa sp. HSG14 TaxID=3055593 RepID=UPI0025A8C369|nr:4-hydroxy-3-methylbut-2-enyl diphosphate reductase [Thiotrichales bacterium HSG14]
MKVIKAKTMGMCFGVRDALALMRTIPNPEKTTVYGELVHNPEVLTEITQRGMTTVSETLRIPPFSQAVVITAHGVSQKKKRTLARNTEYIYDTTCPLVRKVHQKAQALQDEGYFIVVIGKSKHVEVKGIIGDLHAYTVVEKPAEVKRYLHKLLGIVCQTTTQPSLAKAIVQRIHDKNPTAQIEYVDTICKPTRSRQQSVEDLLNQVEAMVVVGGANSNNTRQLTELCYQREVPCVQVQNEQELSTAQFHSFNVVGVTAGTSTLDSTIEKVCQKLESY